MIKKHEQQATLILTKQTVTECDFLTNTGTRLLPYWYTVPQSYFCQLLRDFWNDVLIVMIFNVVLDHWHAADVTTHYLYSTSLFWMPLIIVIKLYNHFLIQIWLIIWGIIIIKTLDYHNLIIQVRQGYRRLWVLKVQLAPSDCPTY
jgi:hypothetical protein